jgi:uncharacterized membrane protein YraQ (UPF0718 family)
MDLFAPYQWLSDWLVYDMLKLTHNSQLAGSINFFIYDGFKIITLLFLINYVMAIIRHYLPMERIRDFLASRNWHGFDYFLAAMLGLVTPFCSCSSIPLFVGFLGVGIPLGVTLTFLVASPLLSETAIILLGGVFGLKVMLLYISAGILVSMLAGFALRNVNPTKHINPDILALTNVKQVKAEKIRRFQRRYISLWLHEAWELSRALIPYILLGVGIGAIIHNLVPADFLTSALGKNTWWSVPLATIVSIPVYANAVGVVPIVEALVAKGVGIGTALVVLMATIALSLPEALILKKVMSMKLLVAFFGLVALGIVLIGYTINFLT